MLGPDKYMGIQNLRVSNSLVVGGHCSFDFIISANNIMGRSSLSSYLNVCFIFNLMKSLNSIGPTWEGQTSQIVCVICKTKPLKTFKKV